MTKLNKIETPKSADIDEQLNACQQCVHAKLMEDGTVYCDKYKHENPEVKREIHDVRQKPDWCPLDQ